MILVIMGLGVFPLFICGWGSNSKYSLLGGVRGVAQTISYEIALALLLFIFYAHITEGRLNRRLDKNPFPYLRLFPVLVLVFLGFVAETNRTPFDFSEGESELVSGFNTEYGGGPFALLFIPVHQVRVFSF